MQEYFSGSSYSIADMAIFGWAWRHERHQVDLADFPNVKRWFEAVGARPAVHKALDVSIQQKDNSFGDSLWESYTLFVDPGTQTGYADEEDRHLAYRAFIIVVSLIGLVWMLIFLGMVVEQMRFLMDRWRRKYGRPAVSGHTLVVDGGWTIV